MGGAELHLFFSSLCSLSPSLLSPVLFSFSSLSFLITLINLGEKPKILFQLNKENTQVLYLSEKETII